MWVSPHRGQVDQHESTKKMHTSSVTGGLPLVPYTDRDSRLRILRAPPTPSLLQRWDTCTSSPRAVTSAAPCSAAPGIAICFSKFWSGSAGDLAHLCASTTKGCPIRRGVRRMGNTNSRHDGGLNLREEIRRTVGMLHACSVPGCASHIRFPQSSTTIIPVPVTNNLDRGFQQEQTRYMRESSPNNFSTSAPLSGSHSQANPLFWNILAVSPCGSRFCPDPTRSLAHNCLRMNTLENRQKKIWRDICQSKSPLLNRSETTELGTGYSSYPQRQELGSDGLLISRAQWDNTGICINRS